MLSVVRDGTPTDDELEELGNDIVHWEKLGRRLNVSEPRLVEISQAHAQLSEKAYYMLQHWKQENGSSATYETLCNALKHRLVQRQDLAERFCCINGKYFLQCYMLLQLACKHYCDVIQIKQPW